MLSKTETKIKGITTNAQDNNVLGKIQAVPTIQIADNQNIIAFISLTLLSRLLVSGPEGPWEILITL